MTSPIITEQKSGAETFRFAGTSALEKVLVYGPFVLLLLGPLLWGAVSPLPIFLMEAGAASLFMLWMIRQINSGELSVSWNPLFVPMLAFFGVIAIQLAGRYTAYHYATYSEALLYITYGILCFLVVQTLRRTSYLRMLAKIISAYGCLLALFALLQSVSSNGKLYWFITLHQGGWIYGPYVNHNHYAGLMEMLTPVPLVLAFGGLARGTGKRLALVAAGLMAGTLVLSQSRGGIIAFLVEIALFTFFLLRRESKFRITWIHGLLPMIVVCLLVWLGGSELTQRLASIQSETRTEISGGTRMNIARDGLKMFAHRPILGYGLGTFPEVYPQFRSFYSELWINEAHDDYLQLVIETGILGFAILLWFLGTMYSQAAKKLSAWADDFNGSLTLAAMLGCTGILVHSFVDFNLHIPANAAIFYVLCVLAAMEPRFHQHFHRKHRHSGHSA
jgi:O-antigen ligase